MNPMFLNTSHALLTIILKTPVNQWGETW